MITIHIKWIVAIVVTIGCFIWFVRMTKSKGNDYGAGLLFGFIPIINYLMFWILWLIIFS